MGLAHLLAEGPCPLAQVPGPRVFGAVNPVAESHNPATAFQPGPAVFLCILGLADLQRHLHHFFRGATVGGPFQGPHTGYHGRVKVSDGGGGHAGGEC